MTSLDDINDVENLFEFIEKNTVDNIYSVAIKEYNEIQEYKKFVKSIIFRQSKSNLKLYATIGLRKLKPLAAIYYRSKKIPYCKALKDPRTFYIEYIPYLLLAPYSKNTISPPNHLDAIKEIKLNIGRYKWLLSNFDDTNSKKVLFNLMMFRITKKREYIDKIKDDPSKQYFDDCIVKCSKNEVFVDAGAFNGDSTKQFINFVGGNYRKIIMYEPDENNYLQCQKVMSEHNNIYLRNYALSDYNEKVNFNSGLDSCSRIENSDGNILIEAKALDNDVTEPITFLKADVEGHEISLLRGAEKHIKNSNPIIAICVYHFLEDLWEIPMLLKSFDIHNKYKFYLRHYCSTCAETVLYAVPGCQEG